MDQEAIALLQSINGTLKAMLALAQQRTAQVRAAQPKPIASDRDLDGKFGNPELKFNPRDWTGAPCKGRHFSECPPDLLDMVANTFDWFAEQAEQKHEMTNQGKPVADYKRADAARARGWAARIRAGRHVPNAADPTSNPAWTEGEPEEWASGVGDGF